jgi:hypothetical protein
MRCAWPGALRARGWQPQRAAGAAGAGQVVRQGRAARGRRSRVSARSPAACARRAAAWRVWVPPAPASAPTRASRSARQRAARRTAHLPRARARRPPRGRPRRARPRRAPCAGVPRARQSRRPRPARATLKPLAPPREQVEPVRERAELRARRVRAAPRVRLCARARVRRVDLGGRVRGLVAGERRVHRGKARSELDDLRVGGRGGRAGLLGGGRECEHFLTRARLAVRLLSFAWRRPSMSAQRAASARCCESVERSAAARSVGDSGSGGAGEACGEEDARRVVGLLRVPVGGVEVEGGVRNCESRACQ